MNEPKEGIPVLIFLCYKGMGKRFACTGGNYRLLPGIGHAHDKGIGQPV